MKRSPLKRKKKLERKGWLRSSRRPPKPRSSVNWSLLELGKGELREDELRRLEAQHRRERSECRRIVFNRDGGKCRCCGRRLYLLARNAHGYWDLCNVHEILPRARGGSDVEPKNCVALCHRCHMAVEGKLGRKRNLTLILVNESIGADGPIEFQRRIEW